MTTVFLTFAGMLLLVGAMAIGVLFGRKPITGSCGGMKALGLDMECEICGGDPDRCDSASDSASESAGDRMAGPGRVLAVDATQPRQVS